MRWFDVKYGKKEDRRMWLKLHLMCGVKTNIVTSVEVSDGYAHDYPFFKGLVDRTADNGFNVKEISADKGYLGGTNILASLQRGAIPSVDARIEHRAGVFQRGGIVKACGKKDSIPQA